MSRVPQKVIEKAIQASSWSTMRQKMGAVVYRRKDILGVGCNRRLTYNSRMTAVMGIPYCSLHAEVDAIINGLYELSALNGSSIYIYRKNNRLAKPCQKCMALIMRVGIKEVHWSGEDEV